MYRGRIGKRQNKILTLIIFFRDPVWIRGKGGGGGKHFISIAFLYPGVKWGAALRILPTASGTHILVSIISYWFKPRSIAPVPISGP